MRFKSHHSNLFSPKGKKRRFVFQRTFGCGDGIWTSWPSGYEPDELPDCSTPRYNGAGSRDRTGTRSKSHGILSPGRLPVPPFRHKCDRTSSILPIHYITSFHFCQYPFRKNISSVAFLRLFSWQEVKNVIWYIGLFDIFYAPRESFIRVFLGRIN